MSTLNADKIQVADIKDAFDLVLAHIGDAPTAHQQAIEMVQKVVGDVGYQKTSSVPVFAKAHLKKMEDNKEQAATAATASANAKLIYAIATGAELPQTATPASTPEATAPAEAANSDTTSATETIVEAAKSSLIPAEIDKLAAANDQVKAAIGNTLANASGQKFKKADAIVKAFAKVEEFVLGANTALAVAKAKLDQHESGNHEAAAEIEVPALEGFTPTGISGLTLQPQDLVTANALMTMVTGNDKYTLEQVLAQLKSAEQVAVKVTKSYRDIMSKIRKAAPRTKISGSAGDEGLPGYDITPKMASEIFKDKTFGGLPGELLEFEVPTFDWHGDVPADVPELDPTFRFQGDIVANALDAISENRIPWLFGESGTGKSEFWQQLAARLKMPFIRVNLDTGIVRSDLIGRVTLKPGPNGQVVAEFVEGILVRALKMPCILLLDEFDCGDPEIMPVLQPVLEGRGVRILEDGGRLVSPNPWCRIVITANTNGLGSANGAYLNVNEQSAATRNRMSKWMEMPYLPESEETKVVMERMPGADLAFVQKLVQFAGKARDAYRNGESGQIVSTRQVMEASRMHTKFLPLLKGDTEVTKNWVLDTTIMKGCDLKSANTLKALMTQIFV